jgi:hypothetical protein
MSVHVSGSDVYAAGWVGAAFCEEDNANRATLWKNGAVEWQSLNKSDAYSVFVSGNDVYVAGCETYSTSEAVLWKNGTIQRLALGENYVYARSVFVHGGDVYVGGYKGTVANYARLWKNGISQQLTGADGHYIHSVFVRPPST